MLSIRRHVLIEIDRTTGFPPIPVDGPPKVDVPPPKVDVPAAPIATNKEPTKPSPIPNITPSTSKHVSSKNKT
jgi:hypothetical protein